MPNTKTHFIQAEHNRSLVIDLYSRNPISYKDWVVISAFYAAIHYVEAFIDEHGGLLPVKNETLHSLRKRFVSAFCSNDAYKNYIKLYDISRMMRYLELHGVQYAPKGNWVQDKDLSIFVNAIEIIKKDILSKIKTKVS